jgi:hypothetical protein
MAFPFGLWWEKWKFGDQVPSGRDRQWDICERVVMKCRKIVAPQMSEAVEAENEVERLFFIN